ncbi:hypothetical protein [Botryobacter ruber]|uniref:hypothetical protein n=1 Tax=Botryobacter ruber TaxID=2171629 RepID=UPI000F653456|nr:hypothetical protein [Botryobacter ruber]
MSKSRKTEVGFVETTGWFSLAGLFIPGFTAIGIQGLNSLIVLFGFECSDAWNVLFRFTSAGCILAPWLFFRFIQRTSLSNETLNKWLMLFNTIEYTFLQASIASFLTNGKTLCYGPDGQNGLEFVFTGWFAIPVLFLLSILFQQVQKAKMEQAELE